MLDTILKAHHEIKPFFKEHPIAWKIINEGKQLISSKRTDQYILESLLSNICEYGNKNWRYEPGTPCNAVTALKGTSKVTDCKSLANIFCLIANNIGFYNAVARQIKKEGYRIVTKPWLVAINGKTGELDFEGRWCFGDHWVGECKGLCYDPTFKFMGFGFAQVESIYLGWYAKEKKNENCFTGTYWQADPNVTDSRDVYIRLIPTFDYTFKQTNIGGAEII
jgi:hypothetical protein